MKKILSIFLIGISGFLMAQTRSITTSGEGLTKQGALQDAFRNAISEALGVRLQSETSVENFMVVNDAIQTRTEGYIANYDVKEERVSRDGVHNVTIAANVSLSALEADVKVLTQAIGGVRFLVMYDKRNVPIEEQNLYDFTVERMNELLSMRRYRYIDRKRFDDLRDEAYMIMDELKLNKEEESFVQQLGLRANAEFIIQIRKIAITKRSEAFDTRTGVKATIEARAFDNCTGEGLGTVYMESDWASGADANATLLNALGTTIQQGAPRLLTVFNQYIGEWINNGIPYEIRFYGSGGFRDFRDMRNKLRNDSQFGGQFQMTSIQNFTKINLTWKDQPDELAYQILDFADQILPLSNKALDVKLIYGRQINFAPQRMVVPELSNVPKP
ncbi:MAG: hypothetical protein LAT76_01685 [Schleiferiaceae bacterium]|nr:hypothetical protein [Schleiferiaceae bacterium]